MNNTYTALAIAVIAIMTAALRFFPFAVFSRGKKTPQFVLWLGKALPFAVMGMLVVYCLKGVSFLSAPYGIPELVSCAAVVLLHVWKRNSVISIAGGTALYILIVNLI